MNFLARAVHPQHADLQIQKAKDFIQRHPNLIFASSRMGMNSDRVDISIHKNYTDYSKFQQEIKREWSEIMTVKESFIISLTNNNIPRPLTFKHLAEPVKKENASQKT